MRGVILAAGTGSRLGEITKARTKGMVPVLGKKLIDYLFEFLDLNFFDEIIVVGGYCYEDLSNHILQKGYKNIRVIENKEYLKGNIYTLMTGLKEFENDSFLITNVDHIYPKVMFEKMKKSFSGISAMCDFDRNLTDDDMKVKLADDKSIKLISKKLSDYDCGYIGMSYIDKSALSLYKKSIDLAIEKFGEKAVVENILQIIAENEKGLPLITDLSGFGWYEVDDIHDLKKAEKGLPGNKNFSV